MASVLNGSFASKSLIFFASSRICRERRLYLIFNNQDKPKLKSPQRIHTDNKVCPIPNTYFTLQMQLRPIQLHLDWPNFQYTSAIQSLILVTCRPVWETSFTPYQQQLVVGGTEEWWQLTDDANDYVLTVRSHWQWHIYCINSSNRRGTWCTI